MIVKEVIIMNNTQVSQAFAAQRKTSGKGSNLFFEYDVIYSYGYHFPIAMITEKYQDGRQVALFTMKSYSNTTAKHKNHVYSALVDANYFILPVWFVDMGVNKQKNLQIHIEEAQKAAMKAKRARLADMRQHWIQEETRYLLYHNIAQALF